MEQIVIKSKIKDYTVNFVDNFKNHLNEKSDFIVVDDYIYKTYCRDLEGVISIIPNEQLKSFGNLSDIINILLQRNIKKNSRLVAIGGGTTQDIVGFIASILFRGIDWIFIPTTLLAQADSCIGGKTSINFGEYKNQLGTFYPPSAIYIDFKFLESLKPSDINSGIGEVIKIHILSGKLQIPSTVQEMVYQSLLLKKHYIEIDEFDRDCRKLLNYGHSFGHALESLSDFGISHGEAVIIGMDIANFISLKCSYITKQEFDNIHRVLKEYFVPDRLKFISSDGLIKFLKHDKKNKSDNSLTCILTRGLGSMIKADIQYFVLKEYINEYLEGKEL